MNNAAINSSMASFQNVYRSLMPVSGSHPVQRALARRRLAQFLSSDQNAEDRIATQLFVIIQVLITQGTLFGNPRFGQSDLAGQRRALSGKPRLPASFVCAVASPLSIGGLQKINPMGIDRF